MNTSQQKVNGNTSYRRIHNTRRANYAVLQNYRRANDDSYYSQVRQANPLLQRSQRPAADILDVTDMPPVEVNVWKNEEPALREIQPIPEKDRKPRFSVWKKSRRKQTEPKPAVVKTGQPDENKTTGKASEILKHRQQKQTKANGTNRFNQTSKPPQKSVQNTEFDSRPRSTNERAFDRGSDHYPFQPSQDHTLHQHLIRDMHFNMKSVGHIKYCDKLIGTVFRVGTHYLMTAWHVIRFIINPYMRIGVSDYNWLRLKSRAVRVDFDEDGVSFCLTGRYIYSNIKLDVAVVEIDRQGRRLPPPLKLSKNDTSMIRDVYFIGYGHPSDSRKRVDPFCEVLDRSDARIQAAKESIINKSDLRTIIRLQGLNPGLLIRSYDDVDLHYRFVVQCVMEQGASGAPAISESDGHVVGLLVSGVPQFYFELDKRRIEDISAFQNYTNKRRFELCTQVSAIYESLRNRRPVLAEELFSPSPLLSHHAIAFGKALSG